MSQDKVSIYGVGDIIPDWPEPESIVELAAPTLKQADILFGQLEPPLTTKGEPQVAGEYPPRTFGPEKVSALTRAGFDLVSWASNHTMDRGEQGFFDNLDLLAKNNIAVVGVGKNLEEARKPLILERKGTKIAFLAYCSVLPKGYEARENKAGAAPMRAYTLYEQADWQAGTPPRIITFANREDLAAMVDDINRVRPLADVVVMSIHWGIHHVPAVIAMYQKEVGHAAIDAGVDLILGHHPHILKGIEVYKGRVIFYSLGNFMTPSSRGRKSEVKSYYNIKPDPEYPFYPYLPDARKTIIAKCVIADKKIEKVSFLPVLMNKQAQPEVMRRQDKGFDEVMRYMDEISRDQGMEPKFSAKGNEVVVCT